VDLGEAHGATRADDPDPRTVVIGTRSSALAMWQANHVADALREKFPHIEFKVAPMNTMGDIDQIKPLSDFASKGVFTKELDVATVSNQIQLAVHCMKDLPTTLPHGLYMGAVLPRGDTEDVLVLPLSHEKHQRGSFEDLKEGAVIGTSAMRRTASIAKYYPHLKCQNIRGNVNTRLAKLDRGDYDALILARVGLSRLGMANRISHVLDNKRYGYAVGQGALAIVCRENDLVTQRLVAVLDDLTTRWACEAERGVLRTLNGGCKVPIAIRTTIDMPSKRWLEEHPSSAAESSDAAAAAAAAAPSSSSSGLTRVVHVWCSVMSMDGAVDIHATHTRTCDARPGVAGAEEAGVTPQVKALLEARQLGEELGQMLLQKGASKLLEGIVEPEGPGHSAPKKAAAASQ